MVRTPTKDIADEGETLRKVLLLPLWKPHVGYDLNQLLPCPPDGYEFVLPHAPHGDWQSSFGSLSQKEWATRLYPPLGSCLPLNLVKTIMNEITCKLPNGVDLIYCRHHLYLGKGLAWVTEVDAVWDPIGPGPWIFRRFAGLIERYLCSESCKQVLVFSRFSKQVMLRFLKSEIARRKVSVLPRAVLPSTKVKCHKREEGPYPHFLFLGSANLAGEFEMRGGKETLEAFRALSQEVPECKLTVRSDIPSNVVRRYRDILQSPNVRWIRTRLPRCEIHRLFDNADVMVMPAHYDNWLSVLEAMSNGLPVIATDLYANPERIKDGRTGLLVRPSRHVPYYQDGLPLFTWARVFQKAIRVCDSLVVDDLVKKMTFVAQNRTSVRKMGRKAITQVERGKFSIEHRNQVLQRVFDQAISERRDNG